MKTGNQQKVGVIIVAAGSSRRMDGADKVLALLGGESILVRVVDVFQRCNPIDQIVVVLSEQNLERGKQLVIEHGLLATNPISGITEALSAVATAT